MTKFPRYALYYAAAGNTLDHFGAQLLGYDARTGTDLPFPEAVVQALPDWHELTEDPRQYGFHATLKAPMALADGKAEAELLAACAGFAAAPRSIPVIKPVVSSISGFLAITPAEHCKELEQLAADCVTWFDAYRAPLTPEDRARRNPTKLTARQCEYLDRWGYPYVMEDFRFHMTLTGRLDATHHDCVLAMLRERFAAINLTSLAIDRIALFRQVGATARFQVIGDYPLCDSTSG